MDLSEIEFSVAEERRQRNRKGWAGVIQHYRDACAA